MTQRLLQFVVVIAVALAVGNAWCFSACTAQSCRRTVGSPVSVPPCHHRSTPGQESPAGHPQTPQCAHQLLVSDTRLPSTAELTVPVSVSPVAILPVTRVSPEASVSLIGALEHAPPPPLDLVSSAVLRV